MISIKGLDKAVVLAALYNHSKHLGKGFMAYDPKSMIPEEAKVFVEHGKQLYFDYLKGRVIKVDITNDEFNEVLYDRDNGPGAAARAIYSIRK